MNKLTDSQKETVKILIRLGDSEELAIKTVLAKPEVDDDTYRAAYYS